MHNLVEACVLIAHRQLDSSGNNLIVEYSKSYSLTSFDILIHLSISLIIREQDDAN